MARSKATMIRSSLSVCAERALIWALAVWAWRRSSRRLRSARSFRFLAFDNTGRGRMSVGAVVDTSSRGSYLRFREPRRSLTGKDAAGVGGAAAAAGGAAAG
jgi:hypothetical protein